MVSAKIAEVEAAGYQRLGVHSPFWRAPVGQPVRTFNLTGASWHLASLPAPIPPATGATAGIPGAWTPPGSTPPASVAALQAGTPNPVVASPATGWTSGQYVQTGTTGAAGRATWTGTGWVGGAAPLAAQTEAPTDNWLKADIQRWLDGQNIEYPADATKADLLALVD